MISQTRPSVTIEKRSDSWWIAACRKLVFSQLAKIEEGLLEVIDQDGATVFGRVAKDGLRARLVVVDPGLYPNILIRGSVGAGETFMEGQWQCDDTVALVQILVRNRSALLGIDGAFARLASLLFKAEHWFRRNHKQQSKRNIAAHYDLSNAFFELFLDETMLYSSAIFDPPGTDLKSASVRKIDHICQKLRLTARDRVLEIGTGWGAFAVHAATQYGCHITTTTISEEQYRHTCELVTRLGLSERVMVLKQDYRDLKGKFDKLVSIEMIEAVGHQYLGNFFAICGELLNPDGVMAMQAITMVDQEYERGVKDVDFIKKYIFPGGFLPSITVLAKSATRNSDLKITYLEDITPHYAETLRVWRANFYKNSSQISQLGFSDSFMRMWEFYLCYSEGAFRENFAGSAQIILSKPRANSLGLLARTQPC